MTDVRDPASMIEAAQKAASDGDYLAAERYLHDAAAIQEATLGSSHPDLATTLNNLAFVCERLNKLEEAERGYRRAHAIAVASLSPGHPFIKTSLTNLLEFCASRGIPVWTPPARAEDETEVETAVEEHNEPVAVASRLTARVIAVAALAVVAVIVVLFARQGPTESPEPSAGPSVEPSPAPSPGPSPGPSPEPSPEPGPEPRPAPSPRPTAGREAAVTVLNAQVCSGLEKRGSPDWECTTVTGDAQPGTYIFYTRLLTDSHTTVEHRWYRADRLHQVMKLRVTPSPGNGYRTFSGNTISAERVGDWTVELRAEDGTVLHEERFVVR